MKQTGKLPDGNFRTAVLFSGGKDSCLALHKARQEGYDIRYLLNILPMNKDSFMFHKPDLKLLEKQAEMLGIKIIIQKPIQWVALNQFKIFV